MPGFASILNPAPGVPNNKAIQVFYGASNAQLAMELRDTSTSDDGEVVISSKDTDPAGFIVNPSQLTSTSMSHVNAVFGFTKQKVVSTTKIDVSLLSPVFEVLASTDIKNTTIASCSSKDKSWIYYLSGADESKLKIVQLQVGGGSTTLKASDMRYGTSLAAYYDTKSNNRYVIFQHKVNSGENGDIRELYEYKVDSGSEEISNTGDAAKLTSIATVYHSGKTYLYYTDNDYELRVITKENGNWGSSSGVSDSDTVSSSSQITAISSGDANHLFYTNSSNSTTHLRLPYA
ncbi:hypothetical protein F4861DRAFT_543588 [Xylaria intraflava]|nr:hypothetical protein F4861DRAFT_543588 [Xylaria intraflava]